jgi:WD40 repeat protein
MQHTYLRYECADAFGLVTASSSSQAPQSNSILRCVVQPSSSSSSSSPTIVLTTGGSYCLGYNLKTTSPTIKIGHREKLSGGVGTGRATNSDQIVCIDVAAEVSYEEQHSGSYNSNSSNVYKVATGWVDGAVRVFDVTGDELCGRVGATSKEGCGLVQTLLDGSNDGGDDEGEEFIMREPLVLNGHSGSPVRAIAFERPSGSSSGGSGSTTAAVARLASGANDGSVVLWDIVAETGLFRLLGHRGGITDLNFVSLSSSNAATTTRKTASPSSSSMDLLVSSSLDGLVKIWDLQGQCCIQTIATHKGEVWAASCMRIPDVNYTRRLGGDHADESADTDRQAIDRVRLVTGSTDGQTRVWSIEPPKRSILQQSDDGHSGIITTQASEKESTTKPAVVEDDIVATEDNLDDVCHYMGTLSAPPNVSTSADRIACLHYHPNGKYVGVLHANSKNIDVYLIRSTKESLRKKQRRLRRRKEKSKSGKDENDNPANNKQTKKGGQKRGLLDDPESDDEENKDVAASENPLAAMEQAMDPEKLKASDEFEYFGTVRAGHKLKGFMFVSGKTAGGGVKVVCALTTNAMEVHILKKERYVILIQTAMNMNSE